MIPTDVLITVLRIIIGLLFIGHGAQKLFGWFDGHGLQGTTQFISSLGFRPARLWAVIAALAEFLGGLSLVLGFLTPVGAALVTGAMLAAIFSIHGPKGLWNAQGGFEYNLVLIANALFVALAGPGLYALDNNIQLPWPMSTIFVVSIVVMLIVVAIALVSRSAGEAKRAPQAG